YAIIAEQARFMTPPAEPLPAAAPDDAIAQAVQMLVRAQRPVIVAGRGATDDRCRKLMLQIGERLGAVFGSTLQGQYLFDSPYDVGVIGTLGTSSAIRAMTET